MQENNIDIFILKTARLANGINRLRVMITASARN